MPLCDFPLTTAYRSKTLRSNCAMTNSKSASSRNLLHARLSEPASFTAPSSLRVLLAFLCLCGLWLGMSHKLQALTPGSVTIEVTDPEKNYDEVDTFSKTGTKAFNLGTPPYIETTVPQYLNLTEGTGRYGDGGNNSSPYVGFPHASYLSWNFPFLGPGSRTIDPLPNNGPIRYNVGSTSSFFNVYPTQAKFTHKYYQIPRRFDVEIVDVISGNVGQNPWETMRMHPVLKSPEEAVLKIVDGYNNNEPAIQLDRGSGLIYFGDDRKPTFDANGAPLVTKDTRFSARASGWTFSTGGQNRKYYTRGQGKYNAFIPGKLLQTKKDAKMKWTWRRYLYRQIEFTDRLDWESGLDLEGNNLNLDFSGTPLVIGSLRNINPELTTFKSPGILYLNDNLTAFAEETENNEGGTSKGKYVATPIDYSYAFFNQDGEEKLSAPSSSEASNLVTIDLKRNLNEDETDLQYVTGQITWRYRVDLNEEALVQLTVDTQFETAEGDFTNIESVPHRLESATYGRLPRGTRAVLKVPPAVYLDAKLANPRTNLPSGTQYKYRAVPIGYSVNGTANPGGTTEFELTIEQDTTVTWEWRLEYAVRVKSGAGSGGNPSPRSSSDGETHWFKANEAVTFSVDADTSRQDPLARSRGSVAEYKITRPSSGELQEVVVATGNFDVAAPTDNEGDFTNLLTTEPGRSYTVRNLASGESTAVTAWDANTLTTSQPLVVAEGDSYEISYQVESQVREEAFQVALEDVEELAGRATSREFIIKDWMEFEWVWENEVRYTFTAALGGQTDQLLAGQVFAEYLDEGGTRVEERSESEKNFLWIPKGREVTVGAYYRTIDRCFTLADFAPGGVQGDLSARGLDISVLPDGDRDGRVVRLFSVDAAETPTEILWNYQPTVHRAVIPLGESFNPKNPDAYLVPDLCDGAVLSLDGPLLGNSLLPVLPPPVPGQGKSLHWDKIGQKLFPVHPGSYQTDWLDQNGRTHRIEVVSDYPGNIANLASELEFEDGRRDMDTDSSRGAVPVYDSRGDAMLTDAEPPEPLYYFSKTLPLAGTTDFPASPDAHYHHLFDPTNTKRRPPTKLDLSSSDEWAFQELTHTEAGATVGNTGGRAFEATQSGRSVLLFSHRRNPDESANGNLEEEELAVRVIESIDLDDLDPVQPGDDKLVLGERGIALGHGLTTGADGAYGIVQRGADPVTSIDPGDHFLVDFWLNAKGLRADDAPVKVLTTGDGKLVVTLDPQNATITTDYLGLRTTHPFTTAGPRWKHYIIHVFKNALFGVNATVVEFHLDGVRQEQATLSDQLDAAAPASSTVEIGLSASSLRLGVGADPASALQLDQLRLFNLAANLDPWLTSGEVRQLRTVRDMMAEDNRLRGIAPALWFSFEDAPDGSFANEGTIADVGFGPVAEDPVGVFSGSWERLGLQEVATRLESTLDNAGFGGSGYVLNAVSNYNANLYNRDAEVGAWGPIFPVNSKEFYDRDSPLEVAYYENPYLSEPGEHPNVAWPYETAVYADVAYPVVGPHKDKAIYIASRIGSEGVDRNGRPQQVFDLASYSDLIIYNQPEQDDAGFNPNEEHALVAPSNRAALKIKNLGEDIPNNPPLAAFALQDEINAIDSESDPWVLVQVNNLQTGEPEMHAYQVFQTRDGQEPNTNPTSDGLVEFPRPVDGAITDPDNGLAYEPAENPEDRFLTLDPDPSKTYNFEYKFEYPAFAGDLLIPPYPLNLVIGNATMADARGGKLDNNVGNEQRSYWRDVNRNAWIVSGGGSFFYQYFYPFRGDFYHPDGAAAGTPVAWLPTEGSYFGDNEATIPADDSPSPIQVTYNTHWRSDYPKLKRGETLTYQGGEYFNENPGSNGLPAIVAMAATEVVYDSATPDMLINDETLKDYSARIIRPVDRREERFSVAQMDDAKFSPAAQDEIFIVAERWYFKELPGSLQKRFYFDSLAEKLVFRGYLNDKDSGDPDLTSGPDPINVLEPNIMTEDERKLVRALSESGDWTAAIEEIFERSQNPDFSFALGTYDPAGKYLAGVRELPEERLRLDDFKEAGERKLSEIERKGENLMNEIVHEIDTHWRLEESAPVVKYVRAPGTPETGAMFIHLNSFGVGSALVPSPKLLTDPITGSSYITVAENNRVELDGAPVSLHIIEIIPDRYRGAIKVIEGTDAFSEKVTLQHNGEFGANTDDLYYEWWIRDAAPLDVVANEVLDDGTLKEVDGRGNSLWQPYLPERAPEDLKRFTDRGIDEETAKHLGLHTIVFEGRPDVTLADKLVLMRYKHVNEVNEDGDPTNDWKLVPFEFSDPAAEWEPGVEISDDETPIVTVTGPAPFQWAGAANSPQIQADGSKRYIPQLVMGWVKRVLDRINPYEARFNDFFGNESPAAYSSQIQIAGAPFAGKVALNSDKNVVENVGLIELYETVLARARELSIDNSSNPVSTDGINQALLLAATRLSVLYELLAREAYSDAQDSTITVTDESGLGGVASFTHAFQNMEADLMHEELALLRGTDFRKSYPVYNRIFWNYAKGLGEAAYNVNYNIYDEDLDGFINEDDARTLYPQGHGDAWGHFVSALGMHYTLLQQPVFSWKTRSELYSLMQNVLEVDFLDEKTFAQLAAGKARAGRDIVRNTYRLHYTQDPDGQWQGYTDGADPARAWGVSEWATRSGQAALFDWAVANAILPGEAASATPVGNPENLDRIERLGAVAEIGEVAGGLYEIQVAMDEANGGVNPLGFDADAIAFDIDLEFFENASGGDRRSHFEQIYNRALAAANNAKATLDFATQTENKLRRIADDTNALIGEAFLQDLDYRNRLIEIFGSPYDGTIGFGKAYPEGYEGPDILLYAYLDKTEIEKIVPTQNGVGDDKYDFIEIQTLEKVPFGIGLTSSNIEIDGHPLKQILVTDLYNAALPDGNRNDDQNTQLDRVIDVFTENALEDIYSDPSSTNRVEVEIRRASAYAFQADSAWGQRTSYGRAQQALEAMLLSELELKESTEEYLGMLKHYHTLVLLLGNEIEQAARREDLEDQIQYTRVSASAALTALDISKGLLELTSNSLADANLAAQEAIPGIVGFSNDVFSSVVGALLVSDGLTQAGFDTTRNVLEQLIKAGELIRDELVADLERDLVRLDEINRIEENLAGIARFGADEGALRAEIGTHIQELEINRQEYVTALAEGFRLLKEREAFNTGIAAAAQTNRYEDIIHRLSRNEAMGRYQTAFNHAARYAWLATKAYDYETSLDPGDPAAPGALLDQIVKERQLGLWIDGAPQAGQGGLAEILNHLNGNFQVLKGQLGINNPQSEIEKISLRRELFRIMPHDEVVGSASSDDRWVDALKARIEPDLTTMPEFTRHCRPFSTAEEGPQPGIVIRFSSEINNGVNFFGRPLVSGDHAYSTANFATKIRGFGVWLENYKEAGLATTPRAYLVPVGNDYMRTSSSAEPITRMWNVQEQRIPTPYVINEANLRSPGFIPTLNGVDGGFADLRRHGDFRMYHDGGEDEAVDESELTLDSRLISRSVWNSEWLLIIPGAGLHVDPDTGLKQLAETISDIKLHFQTYSNQGQ